MALTLNANWKATVNKSNAEIRFYVDIGAGIADAFDGDRPAQFRKDHGTVRVDPISIAHDPLTRRMQISQLTVTCFDKWIRPFAVANRLKGKKIEIQIGERSLSLSDFEPYFLGIIEEIRPVPGGNLVELECLDVLSFLRRKKIIGYWFQMHPLEVIEDILGKADVPSGLVNSTSLDPANAANVSIGHLVVGRSQMTTGDDDATVRTPTSGFQLIDELLQICNGTLLPDENGVLSFTLFDPTAVAVATWDDTVFDDFEQEVSETQGELDSLMERYRENLSKLNDRQSTLGSEIRQEFNKLLQEYRQRLEHSIKRIREEEGSRAAIVAARDTLKEIQEDFTEFAENIEGDEEKELAQAESVAPEDLEIGDFITVGTAKGGTVQGKVVQLSGSRVTLLAGSLRLTADLDYVQRVIRGGKKHRQTWDFTPGHSRPRMSECDIRGMRYEEAMEEVNRFVDNAILNNLERISIIHGLGTGALREGVQKALQAHRDVSHFVYARPEQGGFGCTIVQLRG